MEFTMEKIIVDGGYPLSGKVDISGMKNAAVAVIFASVVVSGGTAHRLYQRRFGFA